MFLGQKPIIWCPMVRISQGSLQYSQCILYEPKSALCTSSWVWIDVPIASDTCFSHQRARRRLHGRLEDVDEDAATSVLIRENGNNADVSPCTYHSTCCL